MCHNFFHIYDYTKLETPAPVRTLKKKKTLKLSNLGHVLALGWVTIQASDVDAVQCTVATNTVKYHMRRNGASNKCFYRPKKMHRLVDYST